MRTVPVSCLEARACIRVLPGEGKEAIRIRAQGDSKEGILWVLDGKVGDEEEC